MKKLLMVATIAILMSSCSSSDPQEILDDILDKNSVDLSNLEQHAVTYKNAAGGAEHTDVYCLNGMLGDAVGKDGNWSVAANDLTVNDTTNATAFTYQTTNAKLEKNTSYNTTTAETFEVTKIAQTICL